MRAAPAPFKVARLQATSQLAFQNSVTSAVSATSLYAAKGDNPPLPTNDGTFCDGVTYEIATVTPNATTGGYDAELTVGISA